MVRQILSCISFICLCATLPAQPIHLDPSWAADFNTAKAEASSQGKKIFLYFSGSDWCKPCIRLRDTQINSDAFTQFAAQNMILLQADFPRLKKNQLPKERQRENDALAEKYNPEGAFPLIVILTPDGNIIGKTGYQDETPAAFVQRIKRLMHLP